MLKLEELSLFDLINVNKNVKSNARYDQMKVEDKLTDIEIGNIFEEKSSKVKIEQNY